MLKNHLSKLFRLFFIAWLGILWPVFGYASSYKQLTIDESVQNSELIFEGVAENISYKIPSDRERIYTFVTFKIIDILKGNYSEPDIELRYPGGELNGMVEKVSDMTIPKIGEQGIYFVKSLTEHFIHPLTGWSQGQMLIVKDNQGERRVYSVSGQPIRKIGPFIEAGKKRGNVDLSPDVALGVVTGQAQTQAISVNEAKKQLQNIIGN